MSNEIHKVYVVTEGEYSDYRILGVFSTEDLAKEYCGDFCTIEEYELDAAGKEEKFVQSYLAWVNLETGMLSGKEEGVCIAIGDKRETHVGVSVWPSENPKWGNVTVRSFVSQDHANKVAIEKRQEWLRTKSTRLGAVHCE